MKKKEIIKEVSKRFFYSPSGAITCEVIVEFKDEDLWAIDPAYTYIRHHFKYGQMCTNPAILNTSQDAEWGTYRISVKATATPSGGDTYDKKKGEQIAYSKAMRRVYKVMARWLYKVDLRLTKWLNDIETKRQVMCRYLERESKFLKSLL